MPVVPINFFHGSTVLRVVGQTETAVVTYGFATGPTNPDITMANLTRSLWQTHMLSTLSSSWELVETTLLGNNGITIHSAPVPANPGTDLTQPDIPQAAVLVRKNTALPGRRFRGRFFLPGIPSQRTLSDGKLQVPDVTAYQTALDAWRAAMEGAAVINQMVLLHDVGLTPTPGPTNITTLSVEQIVTTVEKRKIV